MNEELEKCRYIKVARNVNAIAEAFRNPFETKLSSLGLKGKRLKKLIKEVEDEVKIKIPKENKRNIRTIQDLKHEIYCQVALKL